jgi:hypothetical protein
MARLLIKGDDLVVRPSWWQAIATGHRRIRVPLSAVSRVCGEPSWWRPLRGEPKRAGYIPGMAHLGVWRHEEGQDFIAVRPWKPVVIVETHGRAPFARIAVSVRDADAAAALVPDHRQRPDTTDGASHGQ